MTKELREIPFFVRNLSIISSQTALEPVIHVNVDKASGQWILTQGL